ncbi:MAG: helix-turn-helix transcriptional regulator [Gemmatimonadetes bacterium]|nr:helix-turn-helix transcriptional regulator [Gemmatimonadota bacterium]
MNQQDLFERIVALLHDAALDDVHWSEAARLINQAGRMKSNALAFSDRRHQPRPELFFFRLIVGSEHRDDLERAHLRDFLLYDESIPRVKKLCRGELAHTTEMYTDHEKKTSRTYDLMRGPARQQNGLRMYLDGPVGSHIVWALGDSIAPGGWGSEQVRMVSSLVPHVRQFARVLRAVADAEAQGCSLADLLDNERFGVIQLDGQGRVLEANDLATGLLRQGDGLFDRDGLLAARRTEENSELQRLLACATSPLSARLASGSMTVQRTSRQPRLVVHVHPVAGSRREVRSRRVAALVLVVEPDRPVRVDPGLVAASLGLTPAEARLAVMLARGHSLSAIAAMTQRTESTVRWHVKQIFRKQRISRQAELVRRVLSLDGFPGSER